MGCFKFAVLLLHVEFVVMVTAQWSLVFVNLILATVYAVFTSFLALCLLKESTDSKEMSCDAVFVFLF